MGLPPSRLLSGKIMTKKKKKLSIKRTVFFAIVRAKLYNLVMLYEN